MSRSATKPCTRCGNDDPRHLRSARKSKWWCIRCISEYNRDYWNRNRERILSERRRKAQNGSVYIMNTEPDEAPRLFRLIEDPTGLYRPHITEFRKRELEELAEDRFAPTGSRWQDDNGNVYEIVGQMLQEHQMLVLVGGE